MNIEQLIESNKGELRQLFRKYRIKSEGLEGIREGALKHGPVFVGRVAGVLNNNFSANDGSEVGPPAYDYGDATGTQKSIWDGLNKILGFVDSAGNSYYNLRQNVNGPLAEPYYVNPAPSGTNWLMIGGVIVFIMLIIVLFRN